MFIKLFLPYHYYSNWFGKSVSVRYLPKPIGNLPNRNRNRNYRSIGFGSVNYRADSNPTSHHVYKSDHNEINIDNQILTSYNDKIYKYISHKSLRQLKNSNTNYHKLSKIYLKLIVTYLPATNWYTVYIYNFLKY